MGPKAVELRRGHFNGVGTFAFGGVVAEAAIPEPSTWAMMLLGLTGLGYAGYKRRGVLARA